MTQSLLNRSIERWRGCDPQYMATEQSPAAIAYAFIDAQHDILALAEVNRDLLVALKLAQNFICFGGINGMERQVIETAIARATA